MECDRLLNEARQHATAMHGLAEVEGNPMKVREAQQRMDRDIGPLAREVQRALHESGREELFSGGFSGGGGGGDGSNSNDFRDMESLISNSDALLRESQALCFETEHIGNITLNQMGQQREQLEGANRNISATMAVALQARIVLNDMYVVCVSLCVNLSYKPCCACSCVGSLLGRGKLLHWWLHQYSVQND
jgi:hypothetical protein